MENSSNDLQYICEIVQRGRIKPAKYKHWLNMPRNIFDDLVGNNIIRPENYFIDQTVFFEYKEDSVTMNFISLYIIDDLHIRILSYLLDKQTGNTITRGGTMF